MKIVALAKGIASKGDQEHAGNHFVGDVKTFYAKTVSNAADMVKDSVASGISNMIYDNINSKIVEISGSLPGGLGSELSSLLSGQISTVLNSVVNDEFNANTITDSLHNLVDVGLTNSVTSLITSYSSQLTDVGSIVSNVESLMAGSIKDNIGSLATDASQFAGKELNDVLSSGGALANQLESALGGASGGSVASALSSAGKIVIGETGSSTIVGKGSVLVGAGSKMIALAEGMMSVGSGSSQIQIGAGDIKVGGQSVIGADSNNAIYLGGQPASYYTNASNLNTGQLNSGRLPATLAAFYSITPSDYTFAYYSNSTTLETANITSFGLSLLDDADASAARSTLGAQAALGYTPANIAGDTFSGLVSIFATNTQLKLGSNNSFYWSVSRDNANTGDLIFFNNPGTTDTEILRISNTGTLLVSNNVVFTSAEISSQAVAEAGTNNSVVMTPLRVSQAISAQIGSNLPATYLYYMGQI